MERAEMVGTENVAPSYRALLMKAAAAGDRDAQRQLMRYYDAWVYSPGERDAFMQCRGDG